MISVNQLKYKLLTSALTVLLMSSCGGGAGTDNGNNSGFTNSNTNTKPQISSESSSDSSSSSSSSSAAFSTSTQSSQLISSVRSSSSSSKSSLASSLAQSSKVSISIDTAPPSAPDSFVAQNVLYDRVLLKWSASIDNVGVIFYKIYRDNIQIDTITSENITYFDFDVAANKTYSYSISAGDAAGNWSALSTLNLSTPSAGSNSSANANSSSATSNQSSVAAPDTTKPAAPDQVIKVNASSTQVDISWTAATDNVGVTNYRIYRDSILLKMVTADTLTYSDKTAAPGISYWYGVTAGDAAGNWSSQKFVNIKTPTALAGGAVTLKWSAPVERENGLPLSAAEIGGYEIRYRIITDNNYTYKSVDKSLNQITISGLTGAYIFEIAVFDTNALYSNFVSIAPR